MRWLLKKVWIFSLLLFVCCACGSLDSGNSPAGKSRENSVQASDGHNAMTSLDYYGIYKADSKTSAVLEVELAAQNRYRLLMAAGGEKTGEYRWDSGGSVVILLGSGMPDIRFFVGENFLRLNSTRPSTGERFSKQ